jgi:hypothetical protein
MTHAVWLAHGGVQDAGPVLIMLVPAGILYGIGLILCLSPVISAMNKPPKSEAEELAAKMLGDDEAKEQVRRSRRLRSIRRREAKEVREVIATGPRRDDGG